MSDAAPTMLAEGARLPAAAMSLGPHPAQPGHWPGQVLVRVANAGSPNGPGILLQFELQGDIDTLVWPEPADDEHTDGLWQHTCFEAFVGLPDQARYHEFNFSPSSQWAAYRFTSERQRSDPASEAPLRVPEPVIEAWRHTDRAAVVAWLPYSALPEHDAISSLQWNFTAVLESRDGSLSYWALNHPVDKPDFHHPAGRTWQAPLPVR